VRFITNRDIVARAMAKGLDPKNTHVSDVMSDSILACSVPDLPILMAVVTQFESPRRDVRRSDFIGYGFAHSAWIRNNDIGS
jgi:hypothetical protein